MFDRRRLTELTWVVYRSTVRLAEVQKEALRLDGGPRKDTHLPHTSMRKAFEDWRSPHTTQQSFRYRK